MLPTLLRPPPQFDLSDRLRERGWVVPAYSLAKGNQDVKVMRVVCRWGWGGFGRGAGGGAWPGLLGSAG
jgi:glutamate/tyrosine decarboxylase-like PLP-dependent enzyme